MGVIVLSPPSLSKLSTNRHVVNCSVQWDGTGDTTNVGNLPINGLSYILNLAAITPASFGTPKAIQFWHLFQANIIDSAAVGDGGAYIYAPQTGQIIYTPSGIDTSPTYANEFFMSGSGVVPLYGSSLSTIMLAKEAAGNGLVQGRSYISVFDFDVPSWIAPTQYAYVTFQP